MYKRGENLKETLRIDMTKIREKNTNWYATILGFFRDEDTENEQDSGYEEWKKENADIINLKEIANLRLENPDMPLLELGKLLKNPVGKSGVNYRLKKIIEIANED